MNTSQDDQDEVTYLRRRREERKQRHRANVKRFTRWIRYLTSFYALMLLVYYGYYLKVEKSFDFKGKVEDSCQDLDTIRRANDNIYPLVNELVKTKFFRIFRVNLENECPFWVGNFICSNRKCAVCECNSSEIPKNWLQPQSEPVAQLREDHTYWGPENDMFGNGWVWHVEDSSNEQGIYVDLTVNPEAYTGYQGQHIWQAIYNENCFRGGEWEQLCREERALNKMISGLHTSISTQLSEYYVDIAKNKTYPNYPMYFKQVGSFPDRIKNLFFLYSVMLRALNLAQPVIEQYDLNTMDFQEDMRSKLLLNQIYNISLSQCSIPFDEKSFFKEIKMETKRAYQRYIHNISMIMDCVECEKCKVYGKMQTYGLGTALKILFSDDPEEFRGKLKRNELIAFVNTFAKISSSVHSVAQMFERRSKYLRNLGLTISAVGGILLLFLYACLKIYDNMDRKVERMFKHMPQAVDGRKSKID